MDHSLKDGSLTVPDSTNGGARRRSVVFRSGADTAASAAALSKSQNSNGGAARTSRTNSTIQLETVMELIKSGPQSGPAERREDLARRLSAAAQPKHNRRVSTIAVSQLTGRRGTLDAAHQLSTEGLQAPSSSRNVAPTSPLVGGAPTTDGPRFMSVATRYRTAIVPDAATGYSNVGGMSFAPAPPPPPKSADAGGTRFANVAKSLLLSASSHVLSATTSLSSTGRNVTPLLSDQAPLASGKQNKTTKSPGLPTSPRRAGERSPPYGKRGSSGGAGHQQQRLAVAQSGAASRQSRRDQLLKKGIAVKDTTDSSDDDLESSDPSAPKQHHLQQLKEEDQLLMLKQLTARSLSAVTMNSLSLRITGAVRGQKAQPLTVAQLRKRLAAGLLQQFLTTNSRSAPNMTSAVKFSNANCIDVNWIRRILHKPRSMGQEGVLGDGDAGLVTEVEWVLCVEQQLAFAAAEQQRKKTSASGRHAATPQLLRAAVVAGDRQSSATTSRTGVQASSSSGAVSPLFTPPHPPTLSPKTNHHHHSAHFTRGHQPKLVAFEPTQLFLHRASLPAGGGGDAINELSSSDPFSMSGTHHQQQQQQQQQPAAANVQEKKQSRNSLRHFNFGDRSPGSIIPSSANTTVGGSSDEDSDMSSVLFSAHEQQQPTPHGQRRKSSTGDRRGTGRGKGGDSRRNSSRPTASTTRQCSECVGRHHRFSIVSSEESESSDTDASSSSVSSSGSDSYRRTQEADRRKRLEDDEESLPLDSIRPVSKPIGSGSLMDAVAYHRGRYGNASSRVAPMEFVGATNYNTPRSFRLGHHRGRRSPRLSPVTLAVTKFNTQQQMSKHGSGDGAVAVDGGIDMEIPTVDESDTLNNSEGGHSSSSHHHHHGAKKKNATRQDVDDFVANIIHDVPGARELKSLLVHHTPLSAKQMARITFGGLAAMPLGFLQRLALRFCELDGVSLLPLVAWLAVDARGPTGLHSLDLSDNNLSAKDLALLATAICGTPSLVSLSIRNNPLFLYYELAQERVDQEYQATLQAYNDTKKAKQRSEELALAQSRSQRRLGGGAGSPRAAATPRGALALATSFGSAFGIDHAPAVPGGASIGGGGARGGIGGFAAAATRVMQASHGGRTPRPPPNPETPPHQLIATFMTSLHQLEHLDIGFCGLTDTSVVKICNFLHEPDCRLKFLNIDGASITISVSALLLDTVKHHCRTILDVSVRYVYFCSGPQFLKKLCNTLRRRVWRHLKETGELAALKATRERHQKKRLAAQNRSDAVLSPNETCISPASPALPHRRGTLLPGHSSDSNVHGSGRTGATIQPTSPSSALMEPTRDAAVFSLAMEDTTSAAGGDVVDHDTSSSDDGDATCWVSLVHTPLDRVYLRLRGVERWCDAKLQHRAKLDEDDEKRRMLLERGTVGSMGNLSQIRSMESMTHRHRVGSSGGSSATAAGTPRWLGGNQPTPRAGHARGEHDGSPTFDAIAHVDSDDDDADGDSLRRESSTFNSSARGVGSVGSGVQALALTATSRFEEAQLRIKAESSLLSGVSPRNQLSQSASVNKLDNSGMLFTPRGAVAFITATEVATGAGGDDVFVSPAASSDDKVGGPGSASATPAMTPTSSVSTVVVPLPQVGASRYARDKDMAASELSRLRSIKIPLPISRPRWERSGAAGEGSPQQQQHGSKGPQGGVAAAAGTSSVLDATKQFAKGMFDDTSDISSDEPVDDGINDLRGGGADAIALDTVDDEMMVDDWGGWNLAGLRRGYGGYTTNDPSVVSRARRRKKRNM